MYRAECTFYIVLEIIRSLSQMFMQTNFSLKSKHYTGRTQNVQVHKSLIEMNREVLELHNACLSVSLSPKSRGVLRARTPLNNAQLSKSIFISIFPRLAASVIGVWPAKYRETFEELGSMFYETQRSKDLL